MIKIVKKIKNQICGFIKAFAEMLKPFTTYRNPKNFAYIGAHTQIGTNVTLVPGNIVCEDFTRIQDHVNMISWKGRLRVKKYAAIASGCTIVPGTHTPTVGVPQYLSFLHINDVNKEIVINEDAWVGTGSILLSHCSIGRGAVVGAGAIVTKDIPPYAVVAGSPAKIIATRFTKEQIIEHEKILYPEDERLSISQLDDLFETVFKNKKSVGTSYISDEDKRIVLETKLKFGIPDYSQS